MRRENAVTKTKENYLRDKKNALRDFIPLCGKAAACFRKHREALQNREGFFPFIRFTFAKNTI